MRVRSHSVSYSVHLELNRSYIRSSVNLSSTHRGNWVFIILLYFGHILKTKDILYQFMLYKAPTWDWVVLASVYHGPWNTVNMSLSEGHLGRDRQLMEWWKSVGEKHNASKLTTLHPCTHVTIAHIISDSFPKVTT